MVGVPEGGGVCEGEAVRVAGLGVGDLDTEGLRLGALVLHTHTTTAQQDTMEGRVKRHHMRHRGVEHT
jgi:hypothetical protein